MSALVEKNSGKRPGTYVSLKKKRGGKYLQQSYQTAGTEHVGGTTAHAVDSLRYIRSPDLPGTATGRTDALVCKTDRIEI